MVAVDQDIAAGSQCHKLIVGGERDHFHFVALFIHNDIVQQSGGADTLQRHMYPSASGCGQLNPSSTIDIVDQHTVGCKHHLLVGVQDRLNRFKRPPLLPGSNSRAEDHSILVDPKRFGFRNKCILELTSSGVVHGVDLIVETHQSVPNEAELFN